MRKTHEQFVKDLKDKNITVEPYDNYISAKEKIRFKCLICGHITKPKRPDNVLNGKNKFNCDKCEEEDKKNRKKLTHEQFVERVHNKNSKIKVLSRYTDLQEDVEIECLICGTKDSNKAFNILYNGDTICKTCLTKQKSQKRALSQEEVINRILKHEKPIEFKLNYKNQNSKAKCRCLKCGHEWKPFAQSLMNGSGCPKCERAKSHQCQPKKDMIFKKEVLEMYGHSIELKSSYKGAYKPIKVKCNVCGEDFDVNKARNLIRRSGCGCPICNLSAGALKVYNFLKRNGYTFEMEYTFEDLKGEQGLLRFDFAILLNKQVILTIEYDGEFHFHDRKMPEQDVEKQKRYDDIKDEYCENNNIPIIRIPYWEIKNIDTILQTEIKNKLIPR